MWTRMVYRRMKKQKKQKQKQKLDDDDDDDGSNTNDNSKINWLQFPCAGRGFSEKMEQILYIKKRTKLKNPAPGGQASWWFTSWETTTLLTVKVGLEPQTSKFQSPVRVNFKQPKWHWNSTMNKTKWRQMTRLFAWNCNSDEKWDHLANFRLGQANCSRLWQNKDWHSEGWTCTHPLTLWPRFLERRWNYAPISS